jgi:hypothetical protein
MFGRTSRVELLPVFSDQRSAYGESRKMLLPNGFSGCSWSSLIRAKISVPAPYNERATLLIARRTNYRKEHLLRSTKGKHSCAKRDQHHVGAFSGAHDMADAGQMSADDGGGESEFGAYL